MKEFFSICVAYALAAGLIPGALGLTCWKVRLFHRSKVNCDGGSCMVRIHQAVGPIVEAGCGRKHETGYKQYGNNIYYFCNEDVCNTFWKENLKLLFQTITSELKNETEVKLKDIINGKLNDEIIKRNINNEFRRRPNDQVIVQLSNETKVEKNVKIKGEVIGATRDRQNYEIKGKLEGKTDGRLNDKIKGKVVDVFTEKLFSGTGYEVFDETKDRPSDERQLRPETGYKPVDAFIDDINVGGKL